jgi:hypothetical protein
MVILQQTQESIRVVTNIKSMITETIKYFYLPVKSKAIPVTGLGGL